MATARSFSYWFPWTGSAKHRTLLIMGREFCRFEIEDEGLALKFHNANPSQIKSAYKNILQNPPQDLELADRYQNLIQEKYDSFLPKDLLIESNEKKYIDTNISIDEIGLNQLDFT